MLPPLSVTKDGCGERALGPRVGTGQVRLYTVRGAYQLVEELLKRSRDAARATWAEPFERLRRGAGHDARLRRPRSISSSSRLGRRASIMLEVGWQLLHRNPRRGWP